MCSNYYRWQPECTESHLRTTGGTFFKFNHELWADTWCSQSTSIEIIGNVFHTWMRCVFWLYFPLSPFDTEKYSSDSSAFYCSIVFYHLLFNRLRHLKIQVDALSITFMSPYPLDEPFYLHSKKFQPKDASRWFINNFYFIPFHNECYCYLLAWAQVHP